MATLVAAKEKMFVTQTKLLYEVTWKTVEQITKKHVVSELSCEIAGYGCPMIAEIFYNIINIHFYARFIFLQVKLLDTLSLNCNIV